MIYGSQFQIHDQNSEGTKHNNGKNKEKTWKYQKKKIP